MLNTGPVSVLVDASNFPNYKSGIFSNCGERLDHAVLAVGYDESENYIVKNSWGTDWGMDGYITIQSGSTCGITQHIYQPIMVTSS